MYIMYTCIVRSIKRPMPGYLSGPGYLTVHDPRVLAESCTVRYPGHEATFTAFSSMQV